MANITLDCVLAIPAIVRHEPADMDGKAINHLIPQPIVDLPFYCDQNSADQAVVSGGDPQHIATINFVYICCREPQIGIFEYDILAVSQRE